MNNSVWKYFCLIALALLTTGCGPGGPTVYKAGGVVTYKGQPVDGATVTFVYDDGNTAFSGTDASGKFQLVMMGSNRAGAVPGKGTLTVTKLSGGTTNAPPGKIDPATQEADMKKKAEEMKQKMMGGAPPPEAVKWLLPQKYGDAGTSGLKLEVLPKNDNNFVVELKD
jgi:hypothetical protein